MPRFVPRERKHKKIARVQKAGAGAATDSNATEVVPETQSEREKRRNALRDELRAAQPEMSSKKRKRLDKYIDTKLKKDENAELLRKLETQKIDTSLMQSSRKLGRVTESKREKMQRALKERQAGIGDDNDHSILFARRPSVESFDEGTGYSEDEAVGERPVVAENAIPIFGSGLKRALDSADDGTLVITRRKRRKRAGAVPVAEPMSQHSESTSDSEDEWRGFSDADEDVGHESSSARSASDSTEEKGSESPDTSDDETERPARVSAFKAWADTERNKALDFTPSADNPETLQAMKEAAARFKPREASPDPVAMELVTTVGASADKPSNAVSISRSEEVEKARLELPVVQEEQRIMESVHSHPVTVICGATGSGKTTQVPQMLLESGYAENQGLIGVTQPRRVAATSVAARVAHELGPDYGRRVAHQVRYDTSVKPDTMIKFMTDGVLLREIQQDFALSKYRVIIIDEAHERSVNTDVLIGMLSRIVPLRAELSKEEPDKHKPLKLIIMSATLSHGVDSFLKNEKLWLRSGGIPPVVEAEGRQYPVTVHFARRTRRDFLAEMVDKVARGHRKLPPGGMLVFLTGQQEISTVAKKLRERLSGGSTAQSSMPVKPYGALDDYEDMSGLRRDGDFLDGEEDPIDLDSDADITLNEDDDAEFDIPDEPALSNSRNLKAPLKPHILPLYAALPSIQQLKVFQPAPEGHRSIILATNVAETSLTISGVRYVFDSGRVKEKRYDTSTGVQTFEVDWISKASAEQRKGRAGRTGPGHVWRLYSSNVYEEFFAEETVPEILRTPLESTVLQLKALEIDNVANFPFPTSPELHQLDIAERLLINLGAIDKRGGSVTPVGMEIMKYPVSPRFGKMLMLARANDVVAHAIGIVAALGVGDLIVPEMQTNDLAVDDNAAHSDSDEDGRQIRAQAKMEAAIKTASNQKHQAYTRAQAQLARWDDRSDVMKLLVAVAIHADAQDSGPLGTGASARCQEFFLREKGMDEVQLLRRQLHNIMGTNFQPQLSLLSDKQRNSLNQMAAAGFIDQVAVRADTLKEGIAGRKPRRANEVPYRTLFPTNDSASLEGMSPEEAEIQRSVFVHSSSVLAKLSPKEMPHFIVYSHLSRAAPSAPGAKSKKTRIHPLTAIGPKALAVLAEGTPLLQIGKPIGKIEDLPRSPAGKQRRQCWVSIGLQAPGSGAMEWPLGAWRVIQVRTRDWEIEKVVAR